ncbi:hypothetical protein [Azoarcus sp. KH32C]|uniref:hypothetical protein n=1 Tax=Azoarcus sp. KH32C TaxID=748247 RepID=UPI00023866AB|nr:hypothetical protein [Azoarcus sp. KH32C]BAL22588.1 hypothetical protein AZKH_0242 [Azoarcus sp. KH32C]
MLKAIRNFAAIVCATACAGLLCSPAAFARADTGAVQFLTPVKVDGKRFVQDGREVILNGVNYFPAYFPASFPESWLKSGHYRAEIVDRDLATIQALGANLVSVAAVGANGKPDPNDCANIRDFLARAAKHGLLVNLYIGTGSKLPLPDANSLAQLPKACALAGIPALFAYDIAWEPHFGEATERAALTQRWLAWLAGAYGTEANARRAFGGDLSLPSDQALCAETPNVKVSAFRRFLDDMVSASYRAARAAIHAVDTTHLIGARSGWGGNGSRQLCKGAPPDLRAGVKHLDFVSPEAHALPVSNRAEILNRGRFTAAYADVGKPIFWAEYAANADGSCPLCNEEVQAAFYSSIFEMIRGSASNGGAAWWFVGTRPQNPKDTEKSDFGIVRDRPDRDDSGQIRPAARLLNEAMVGIRADLRSYSDWIVVDRDAAAGDWRMYDTGTRELARLGNSAARVGVRTSCTGATSKEAPTCVGNVANNGACPPKCLNAEWTSIEIRNADGAWQKVKADDEVSVRANAPVLARLVAGNTGEGTWLTRRSAGGIAGSVRFGCNEHAGDISCRGEIHDDIGSLEDTTMTELLITDTLTTSSRVAFQMVSEHVAWFGERIEVTLSPR